jgi:hypothetical protein
MVPAQAPLDMDEWARKYIEIQSRKHQWRIPRWMSVEDLAQEGALIWHTVQQRYQPATMARAMALTKKCLQRRIIDLDRLRKRDASTPAEDAAAGIAVDEFLEMKGWIDNESSTLRILIGELPDDIQAEIELLITTKKKPSASIYERLRCLISS